MWERLILAITMTLLLHVSMQSQPTARNSSQSFLSQRPSNLEDPLPSSSLISNVQSEQSDACSSPMAHL